jgi:hypothetical protein
MVTVAQRANRPLAPHSPWPAAPNQALDSPANLQDPQVNLDAYVRVRGSRDPKEETVYYWTGWVYAQEPDKATRKVFKFEGFNVARTQLDQNGMQLLSREVAVYRDPETNEILNSWENPWTEDTVPAVQVWNDPVNFRVPASDKPRFPVDDLGQEVCFHSDVFLNYPSPLPRDNFPKYSQSDTYQGTELFQFFADKDDLADPTQNSVPAEISWTRIGPWLPWMQMADRPGNLLYQARGYKLPDGVADLPDEIRDFVEHQHPEFLSAPVRAEGPNETSWTYFKKLLEKGAYPPQPDQTSREPVSA